MLDEIYIEKKELIDMFEKIMLIIGAIDVCLIVVNTILFFTNKYNGEKYFPVLLSILIFTAVIKKIIEKKE